MSFLGKLFGRPTPEATLEHPVFGSIRFSKHDGWLSEAFELWGSKEVELIIDAGREGPSAEQVEAFLRFRDSRSTLLPRCQSAVEDVRAGLGVQAGVFRVSGLTIPSLGQPSTKPGKADKLWTLWFDLHGDDHYMYGVETDDDWKTLVGFADD